jgi:tetratricopeptide (TPR) repeat protein
LAIAEQNIGDAAKALALYDRAYEGRSRVLGPDHPDTLNVLQNRATLLIQAGKAAEAEPQLQQLLLTLKQTRQPDHPAVLVAMNSLAYALEDLGRLDQAEKIQIKARSAHSETFGTRNNLAMLLMREGDLAGAEREFVQVIGLASESLGAEHPYVMIFSNNYGECLTLMHRYAEAEPLLLRTHMALSKLMGADNPRVLKARARLAELYDRMHRPESAAEWRLAPAT